MYPYGPAATGLRGDTGAGELDAIGAQLASVDPRRPGRPIHLLDGATVAERDSRVGLAGVKGRHGLPKRRHGRDRRAVAQSEALGRTSVYRHGTKGTRVVYSSGLPRASADAHDVVMARRPGPKPRLAVVDPTDPVQPIPTRTPPVLPDWFTEAHRARWNRTIAAMKGMGIPATAADEVVLTNFVAAAVLAEECAAQLVDLPLLVTTERGYARNPLTITMLAAAGRADQLGMSLGLSPDARDRMDLRRQQDAQADRTPTLEEWFRDG